MKGSWAYKTYNELIEMEGWLEIPSEEVVLLWGTTQKNFLLWSIQEDTIVVGGEPDGHVPDNTRKCVWIADVYSGHAWNEYSWSVFLNNSYKIFPLGELTVKASESSEILCARCTWTVVPKIGDFCRWC